MPTGQRKQLETKRDNVKRVLGHYEYIKPTIVETLGEEKAEETIQSLNDSINDLENKMHALPIHHEYNGTMYLRRPYSNPVEVIEIKGGKAIMREELITWQVYNPNGDYYGLSRWVYKDPELKTLLKREDGQPVFAD